MQSPVMAFFAWACIPLVDPTVSMTARTTTTTMNSWWLPIWVVRRSYINTLFLLFAVLLLPFLCCRDNVDSRGFFWVPEEREARLSCSQQFVWADLAVNEEHIALLHRDRNHAKAQSRKRLSNHVEDVKHRNAMRCTHFMSFFCSTKHLICARIFNIASSFFALR